MYIFKAVKQTLFSLEVNFPLRAKPKDFFYVKIVSFVFGHFVVKYTMYHIFNIVELFKYLT